MPSDKAKRDWVLRHPEKRKQVARDWARRSRTTKEGRENANAAVRKYAATNRDLVMQKTKEWIVENRLRRQFWGRFNDVKNKYGLAKNTFIDSVVNQFGLCGICGAFGGIFGLQVDHDHKTNIVRGFLCGDCNSGIGRLKTPEACIQAARYLQSH